MQFLIQGTAEKKIQKGLKSMIIYLFTYCVDISIQFLFLLELKFYAELFLLFLCCLFGILKNRCASFVV